jgi:hypothetical protein
MAISDTVRDAYEKDKGVPLKTLVENPELIEPLFHIPERKPNYSPRTAEEAEAENRRILQYW